MSNFMRLIVRILIGTLVLQMALITSSPEFERSLLLLFLVHQCTLVTSPRGQINRERRYTPTFKRGLVTLREFGSRLVLRWPQSQAMTDAP